MRCTPSRQDGEVGSMRIGAKTDGECVSDTRLQSPGGSPEERGFSLIWVLAITTVALIIIGAVGILSPANMRQVVFDNDRTLALYAAESGINHALALLHRSGAEQLRVLSPGGSWTPEDEAISTTRDGFIAVPNGGEYRWEGKTTSEGRHALTATGRYGGRTREVSVVVHLGDDGTAGGRIFQIDQAQQVAAGGSKDPNFVYIEVKVPRAWEHKDYNSPTHVGTCSNFRQSIENMVYRVADICTLKQNEIYTIKNSTVFLDGLKIPQQGKEVVLNIENSDIYIDGDLEVLKNGGLTIQFVGSGDNNIYIGGSFTSNHHFTILGDPGNKEPSKSPWNSIYVGQQLRVTENHTNIGVEGAPTGAKLETLVTDVVFVMGCEGAPDDQVNMDGSQHFYFNAGIYAPCGKVSVKGYSNQNFGAGAISAREVDIPDKLKTALDKNWSRVGERMRSYTLGRQRQADNLDSPLWTTEWRVH